MFDETKVWGTNTKLSSRNDYETQGQVFDKRLHFDIGHYCWLSFSYDGVLLSDTSTKGNNYFSFSVGNPANNDLNYRHIIKEDNYGTVIIVDGVETKNQKEIKGVVLDTFCGSFYSSDESKVNDNYVYFTGWHVTEWGDYQFYDSSSIIQAGTTISLKAYQLNFS